MNRRALSIPGGGARGLIVTADDFGAAAEVNAAVEQAHRDGVLTAASLMVGAPAAGEAVAMARRLPRLAVGLHLVLVEGRPTLPAREVAHLVDADGRFRRNMSAAGATMFFHPAARRELATEIAGQFAAFAATGLALDHVNAHKHFHLHPTIASLIVRIGRRFGLRAVRAPVEPGGGFVSAGARLLRRRLRAAGLLVPDQVFGLRWSGAMTAGRLEGVLAALPAGLTEIYLHPATSGGFAGAAPSYRYADELAALVSPKVLRAARDIPRGGFLDFAGERRPTLSIPSSSINSMGSTGSNTHV